MRILSIGSKKFKLEISDIYISERIKNFIEEKDCEVDGVIKVVFEDELVSDSEVDCLTPIKEYKEAHKYVREYYEFGRLVAVSCIDENSGEVLVRIRKEENSDILSYLSFEVLMYLHQMFILHSSIVEIDGRSIAFVGRSGIGKSTQASLWEKYLGATIVCGDRGAIYIDKDKVKSCGIPFDGSARVFSNIESDLIGIICLRQGNENKLERLSLKDAFSEIYPQITVNPWNKEFQKDAIDFVFEIISRVPVYRLVCTISQEAVEIVRGEIYGQ